ncbi:MAG: hypothetical protein IE916_11295 [Epsilonproteobacteria bacterium]|nr:hypothetical protein [Campylobacterota bacterium]
MPKSLFLLLLPLLFLACESEIYSSFCSPKKEPPSCLKISALQADVKEELLKHFPPKLIQEECDYTLEAYHHSVKACSNPTAASLGADFDGYSRLTLNYKGECYYKIQQDYKSAPWQESMKRIVKQLKKDIF